MNTESRSHQPWSTEELAKLEIVRASGKTVKCFLDLFPGRSYMAIRQKIRETGGKPRGTFSWVWDAIVRELTVAPGLTGRQLAERIGCCHRHVMDLMIERSTADEKECYIETWVRPSPSLVGPGPWVQSWRLGNLPDAPRPKRLTYEERLKRDAGRRSAKRRAKRNSPFLVALGEVKAPESLASTVSHRRDEMEAA
ncbi:hypothetical protein KTD19_27955 [Burkholderia multivorans]|uniref:hypothetical protein n=1 Tax=Burkholderia multivorans TaxID=87883 RepID=UPI001C21C347|nr:hypothetical protein [Burkholderia multivorans]MBU9236213.1 hypothetical protein [Burkholderia multivorans]